MADTLVERLTGQTTASDVPIEIQIVLPVEALISPDSPLPAQIPGHGPVPVELLSTDEGRTTWRRLVTHDGIIIGGDSHRRRFTGQLAALIRARDGHRCREPYCDAPIRHIDHIRRWRELGRTEYSNGRGLCEFHNHVREIDGWTARTTIRGIETSTPTGHLYTSEIGTLASIPQEQHGAA